MYSILLVLLSTTMISAQNQACQSYADCNYDTCGLSVWPNVARSWPAVYGCNYASYVQKYTSDSIMYTNSFYNNAVNGDQFRNLCFTSVYDSQGRTVTSLCPKYCPSSCPIGQYVLNCECVACPKGSYCTGSATYTSCAAGTYNNNTSSQSENDCIACQSGTYSTTVGATHSSTCVSCPTGYACTGGANITQCITGSTYSLGGQSSCYNC